MASSSSGTRANTRPESASCPNRNSHDRGRRALSFPRLPCAGNDDMDAGLFAQYVMNGLMLGMMYALVAVGFTLFFGVLDVIKFSHGDVLTVGAFTALATFIGLRGLGVESAWLHLVVMTVVATLAMAPPGLVNAGTLGVALPRG